MAMERAGYMSAADFGVGVDGKWGPDKVNFQLTVVNGETYKSAEVGQGKDALARISVRVLDTDDSSRVGGLRVTGYAGYGRAATGDRNRFLGMVSYRSKHLTLAGEAASAQSGPLGSLALTSRTSSPVPRTSRRGSSAVCPISCHRTGGCSETGTTPTIRHPP
jgi:hypothetical protein